MTYTVNWFDDDGRIAKTVNYGSNGGMVIDDMNDDFDRATDQFLDFGTEGSSAPAGFTTVAPGDTYTSQRGYGWDAAANVANHDDQTADLLNRDAHTSADAGEFKIDLPDGQYLVTLYFGSDDQAYTNIRVSAEGTVALSDYSIAAGATDSEEFLVNVSDGQLTLEFSDNDATGKLWGVNGLSVWAVYAGGGPGVNTSNLYDVSTTKYDGLGRTMLVTDNAGRAERTVYDSSGRVTHVIANYREGSDYWYGDGQGGDDFDRPKARDADVNRITKLQYNAAGQVMRRVALDPKADGNEAGQQAAQPGDALRVRR